MKRICVFVVVALMTALYGLDSFAAAKKVAVYVVGGIDSDERSTINSAVLARLSGNKDYIAFERNSAFVNALDKGQDYQVSGEVPEREIRAVGERLGVDYVIVINAERLERDEPQCYMSARLINLVTGLVEKTIAVSGPGETLDNIEALAKKVASSLMGSSLAQGGGSYSSSGGGQVETFNVNGVTFDMVLVEGGTYQMGSYSGESNEQPMHTETIGTFYIGKTEVTQALWGAVMGNNPSYFRGENLPVEKVSWYDCQEFCERLSRLTGRQFRLPTEAEWEYAARGGNKSRGFTYSGSNNLSSVGWYSDNSGNVTHPVATKLDNELGIYDMSGNVWEWCSDNYSSNYSSPRSSSGRVNRGGSWNNSAAFCRVAYRYSCSPDYSSIYLGLRLAL